MQNLGSKKGLLSSWRKFGPDWVTIAPSAESRHLQPSNHTGAAFRPVCGRRTPRMSGDQRVTPGVAGGSRRPLARLNPRSGFRTWRRSRGRRYSSAAMPDLSDQSAEIEVLEAIQNAGLDQVTVDGITTKFNPDLIAKRLRNLRLVDTTDANRRPVVARIKLT